MRLRLLDRYVLKELLYPFVFGIAAFSSIFIASTMLFKITQYMTKYGAPLETVARLFMYNLPEVPDVYAAGSADGFWQAFRLQ